MLFIVLPAFNEEEALPGLLRDIETICGKIPYRLVAVDDGSTDRTLDILRSYADKAGNMEIVQHEHNKGLGEALLSGFNRVADYRVRHTGKEELDVVITMDADGTHPADRIPPLYLAIAQGVDIAIASRFAPGGGQSGLKVSRRLLSWGAGKVMRSVFPISGVKDYSCGYRAYRYSVLTEGLRVYGEELMQSRNFAATVEILLKLAPMCSWLSEVPLRLHYERKKGVSKMRVWATMLGYLRLIYRLKFALRGQMEWAEE